MHATLAREARNPIREASAMTARENLGELLNEVQYRHGKVLITKAGKPAAALVDIAGRAVTLVPFPNRQEASMSVSIKSLGIERLSVAERLVLVEELWDSIAASTSVTDAQRAELDRRLADHVAKPDDVVSWEEIHSSITARLTR